MENFLRRRVKERLDVLRLNPFEAARRAGAQRHFLDDLLSGKKESIRPDALIRVAEVLDCDPEYLVGAQSTPRRLPDGEGGSLPLGGICEAGVWRSPGGDPVPQSMPVAPDPRFPAERQIAYLVRGHHADALGLQDGDVLVVLDEDAIRPGDIIICRRRMETGEAELTARIVERDEVRAARGVPLSPPLKISDTTPLGRVIAAHRIFRGE